ncbi:hypothetical protein ACWIUD_02695 [Helicobacter sp. 23-1044]
MKTAESSLFSVIARFCEAESWQSIGFVSEAKQPSKFRFCDFVADSAIFCIFFVIARFCEAKSWQSIFRFCDSAIKSPFFRLASFVFFAKRAAPRSRSPRLHLNCVPKKLRFFAFRGSASLNPLLAKNRHSHYCSFESDFLHHEAGEIKGASHEFFLDSVFNAESISLRHCEAQIAEAIQDSANRAKNAESNKNCHFERSEKSQNNSDSSLRASHSAQNDKILDCHDLPLANLAMTEKTQNLDSAIRRILYKIRAIYPIFAQSRANLAKSRTSQCKKI